MGTDGNETQTIPPVDQPASTKYLPIVKTHVVTLNENGAYFFKGLILSNGGADILEVGVKISDSLRFQDYESYTTTPNEDTFEIKISDLTAGTTYFYRVFARNEVGTSHGAPKRLKVPALPPPHTWWANMRDAGDGWMQSQWFGTFQRFDQTDWVYHTRLGWVYAPSDTKDGIWLWMEQENWLWTEVGVWPYLWKHDTATWLFYHGKRENKPLFFDYGDNRWR